MKHDSQVYEKIQTFYESFWEIKNRSHKDSDFWDIIRELDSILEADPNNEYALQLKIMIKRSYKNLPKQELECLCTQMHKINPKNEFASTKRLKLKLENTLPSVFGKIANIIELPSTAIERNIVNIIKRSLTSREKRAIGNLVFSGICFAVVFIYIFYLDLSNLYSIYYSTK